MRASGHSTRRSWAEIAPRQQAIEFLPVHEATQARSIFRSRARGARERASASVLINRALHVLHFAFRSALTTAARVCLFDGRGAHAREATPFHLPRMPGVCPQGSWQVFKLHRRSGSDANTMGYLGLRD
jgi:hypothetical protein